MKVSRLKDLYKNRVNDDDILHIDGYEFVPRYLMYLLKYLDELGAKEVTFKKGGRDA